MIALSITVFGRPAPQGSKRRGPYGQLIEASPYLPAWRAAVRKAAYSALRTAGIKPDDRPVYPKGTAVAFGAIFVSHPDWGPITEPPDLDKYLRATWDALTQAQVWHDDSQVTRMLETAKRHGETTGAHIIIREAE